MPIIHVANLTVISRWNDALSPIELLRNITETKLDEEPFNIMETLKKRIEVYKLNRQIARMNTELLAADHYGYRDSSRAYRESEKSFLIRESMNKLLDQKRALLSK